ncbi:hypothetical protein AbraIFM66951_005700 [Aspergillus brasiliensis]|uniref:Uncharacterized protein n=1 Tax=Aspergillus brasiliensis TaxID=319629 RepID=A0A9W5YI69_9EURO|nr:hypothetical protein AbraCBS73388_005959 [Aspergillus brasiliensis]GKZ43984.1 hypothetical protein AbraIFM66951_005700 [Aspergillus brasiliensis]
MAISYEGMGLAAHQFSSQKMPLLQAAVEWFGVCGRLLDEVQGDWDDIFGGTLGGCDSDGEWTLVEGRGGEKGDEDPFVEYHPDDGGNWCEEEDEMLFSGDSDNSYDYTNTTISTYSDASLFDKAEDEEDDGNGIERGLVPSPLKVQKVSGESVEVGALQGSEAEDHATSACKAGVGVSVPWPLPLRIATPTTPTTIYTDTTKEVGIRAMQSVKRTQCKLQTNINTNTTVHFLRHQVTSNITTLQKMITDVAEMQYARRMSKGMRRSGSFWSFSPVKEKQVAGGDGDGKEKSSFGVKESKEQRIARLRRDGWQTVGIRGQKSGWKGERYYREYCERVLDELYLERS